MESIIVFDDQNAVKVLHEISLGEMLIALMIVTLIATITAKWIYEVIKER